MVARSFASPVTVAVVVAAVVVVALGVSGPTTPTARADAPRVVVLGDDAAFARALESALAPWGIAVSRASGAPSAAVPAGARTASAIGRAQGAAAVVWLASSDEGEALFVYDVESGRIIARPSPRAPPLDEASAASLALSVKTLLRHTVASPPVERFGAEAARVEAPSPAPAPAPTRRAVSVATIGGARFFRDGVVSPEPRVGLGLTFWLEGLDDRLGVGLEAVSGPGLVVRQADLVARYVEAQLSLVAVLRALVVDAFALSLVGRVDAVLAFLDGSFALGDEVSVFRVDPQGALLVQVDWALSGARIGVRAGATALLYRQRYLVRGQPVLSLAPVALEAALVAELGF